MTVTNLIKPGKLKTGDTVALITLSWGGASEFQDRYSIGKKQLEKSLGLKVVDTPNALKSADWIKNHPEERLNDLIWAFKNPEIKAILTIIGGDDSIRLFKYLKKEHFDIIRNNPKIFVGFSDTTTINFLCLKANLISFYGPTVLFGFAENGGVHDYTTEYFKKALFSTKPIGIIRNNKLGWTLDRIPWTKENSSIKRKMQKPLNIKFIQGKGISEGYLIGGCMDSIEEIKKSKMWPNKEAFKNSILFFETSEENPSIELFYSWFRDYGNKGILKQINGIIFGIPGGDIQFDDPEYDKKLKDHLEKFKEYDLALLKVAKEYNRNNLIIATQVQFGHICPALTIPYGIKIQLDADNKTITMLESAVIGKE